MLAATLHAPDADDPLAALVVGDHRPSTTPEDWATVTLRAAALNHHDLWSLRGIGVQASWLPCVLGSDGAGLDEDGNEVIIHPLIADAEAGGGDETLDPRRRMLSDGIDGTLAQTIRVPRVNLIPKPAGMSWESAACLPTAWLTAYRMLFGAAALRPGATVLVQGAGGGLTTALIRLARAGGLRVLVTSRSETKRARAVEELGADAAFALEERLPERVDAVMESVGSATWAHSVRALRAGGTLVVAGATSGHQFDPQIARIFLNQIVVIGSALGTRQELRRLATLCSSSGIDPTIDSVFPLASARDAFARLLSHDLFGKVVLTP